MGDLSTASDVMGGGEVKYGLVKTMAIVWPTMWFVAIQERADIKINKYLKIYSSTL